MKRVPLFYAVGWGTERISQHLFTPNNMKSASKCFINGNIHAGNAKSARKRVISLKNCLDNSYNEQGQPETHDLAHFHTYDEQDILFSRHLAHFVLHYVQGQPKTHNLAHFHTYYETVRHSPSPSNHLIHAIFAIIRVVSHHYFSKEFYT